MYAYAFMCYSYVWMRVFMRLSQATNVCAYIYIYIYIYIYVHIFCVCIYICSDR